MHVPNPNSLHRPAVFDGQKSTNLTASSYPPALLLTRLFQGRFTSQEGSFPNPNSAIRQSLTATKINEPHYNNMNLKLLSLLTYSALFGCTAVHGNLLVSHWMMSYCIVFICSSFVAVIELLSSVSFVENPISDDENPHAYGIICSSISHLPLLITPPSNDAQLLLGVSFLHFAHSGSNRCRPLAPWPRGASWIVVVETASSPHESRFSSPSHVHHSPCFPLSWYLCFPRTTNHR